MAFLLLIGFLLGAGTVLALEALSLYWLFLRLSQKKAIPVEEAADHRLPRCLLEKEGVVWVLEQDKIAKHCSDPRTKDAKELKNEIIETSPVKKQAKIKDHLLILTSNDGSQTSIPLLDCNVLAISSSSLPSQKWSKKYPVRIESKTTAIYNGRKMCYLYLETSSMKESWCKALRLASNSDKVKIASYTKLQEGFNSYLASLAVEYPLFQKPLESFPEHTNKSIIVEESSPKVRHFLRKLARKALKIVSDNKSNFESDKKVADGLRIPQDSLPKSGPTRSTSLENSGSTRSTSLEKSSSQCLILPTLPESAQLGSQQISISNFLRDESVAPDEGVSCLNMLLARLFFDAKRSTEINNLITVHLQRTLSKLRTPSYIGGINCTGLNVGSLPPYIHHMRIVPADMREMCILELDIEYNGGFSIEIETRLEVLEPGFQGIVDADSEQSTTDDVVYDLFEDFESYSDQLNSQMGASIRNDKQDGSKHERLKKSNSSSWSSTYKSRWKAIVNSIADHVSQVPITLVIKVASLRGTLRLQIKQPPSDRLWYGFTSMPDINFSVESLFGDHKISSSHVALILTNRIKVALCESIVLPNCESICIPWMSAEKDDWLPLSAAPYLWVRKDNIEKVSSCSPVPVVAKSNNENVSANSHVPVVDKSRSDSIETSGNSIGKSSNSSEAANDGEETGKTENHLQPRGKEPGFISATSDIRSTSLSSDKPSLKSVDEDMKVPLLENYDDQASRRHDPSGVLESPSIFSSGTTVDPTAAMQEDPKAKRFGRRAKMLDFGKRMGEKLEEKRRNIEEKGRHMVEKLKESSRGTSEGGSLGGSISGSFRSSTSISKAE